ncbi:MAG: HEAT repeat domain-containing protein [Planctomycetota bacterium]|jgi:HEAT repeat protein
MKELAFVAAALLVATAASGQTIKAPEKPMEPVDALGRPLKWGKTVRGKRASLSMTRTRLLYGQPIQCVFRAPNPAGKAPFLTVWWEGERKNAAIKLTDADGKAVALRTRPDWYGSGVHGADALLRLMPTAPHALGRYLRPGRYNLQIVATCKRDPYHGRSWTGMLSTNTVAFEVLQVTTGQRRPPVPAALRKKAQPLIRQLEAKDYYDRQAAKNALIDLGLDVIPLLEQVSESGSADATAQANMAIWAILRPIVMGRWLGQMVGMAAVGPAVVELDEPSWKVIKDNVRHQRYLELRSLAARYGSPGPYRDLSKLSEPDAEKVVAKLEHADPFVRMRAVRSLSATSDGRIIRALLGRLKDPFRYLPAHVFGGPPFRFPVRLEARAALLWQGRRAIDTLIDVARGNYFKDERIRYRAVWLLGEAGPDKRTLRFLREVVEASAAAPPYDGIIPALGKMGPPAAGLLLKIAANPQAGRESRKEAIRALACTGDAKQAGPFIVRMLGDEDELLVNAACESARQLKLRKALPGLIAVCRNEKIDFNHRHTAMRGVCALADRKSAGKLMLELTGEKVHRAVRGEAVSLLGGLECREAVPIIMALLNDESSLLRNRADGALRGIAGKPEGVGYVDNVRTPEERKREAEKWHKWWREHGDKAVKR